MATHAAKRAELHRMVMENHTCPYGLKALDLLKREGYEVAEVFEPPLDFLMNPANHVRESRLYQGQRRFFYAMPWEGRYIWGATARMLVGLSERIASIGACDEAGE